ncbi:MAG: cytochrome c3 family protein [Desulfuromonadales bacterium]
MRNLLFILTILLAGGALGANLVEAEVFGGGEISYYSSSFSHKTHVNSFGFDCSACHDDLFTMEAGAMTSSEGFSMDTIYEGEYCGACHDGEMAFSARENCTACHETGEDIYYTKPLKAVLFDHQVHVDDLGFDCESCHMDTFTMKAKAAQENEDFNMEALYKGKYCGSCHDGSMAFASDTRCATCHVGVKGYNRARGDQKDESSH